MFFIYTILMFLFFSLSSFVAMYLTGNSGVFLPFTIIFIVLSIGFFIVGFFINFAQWDLQIKRFERIRRTKKLLKIKNKQFNELKIDWIKYLSVEYPDFEKDIFKKMSPQEKSELKMYFTKYPELSSSHMFEILITNISRMSNEIYTLDQDIEYASENIRSQLQNKWLILNPTIPEDILAVINKGEI